MSYTGETIKAALATELEAITTANGCSLDVDAVLTEPTDPAKLPPVAIVIADLSLEVEPVSVNRLNVEEMRYELELYLAAGEGVIGKLVADMRNRLEARTSGIRAIGGVITCVVDAVLYVEGSEYQRAGSHKATAIVAIARRYAIGDA